MTSISSFAINGRFLTQPLTGVQRYALNVTRAIGHQMNLHQTAVPLLAPANTIDPKILGSEFKRIGRSSGQFWEQAALPRAWPDQLLNLCNTAPALKSNQVLCIHDANVFLEPESYGNAFRLYYKTLQPLLARRVSKITTVSKFSAEKIAEYLNINVLDIVVLPNGHEHVHTWNSAHAEQAPLALARGADNITRPFILALGSNARHKNLSLLFNIASELNILGLDLVIAGGQATIFNSEQLKKSQNIKHLGFVTDHDLAYLFERAFCLAFPSLTEGFGLPVLEAMALGCPVISTDRASLPEICGDAALLAPPDQTQCWIEQIKTLLESSAVREDLIGRGFDQAAKFFLDKNGSRLC